MGELKNDAAGGLLTEHGGTSVSARNLLLGSAAAGASCVALFLFRPETDLYFARIFYRGNHQFTGSYSATFDALRMSFTVLFYSVCAVAAVGLFRTRGSRRLWLTLGYNAWLYLAVCILAGPLLTTNVVFKNLWGRARPRDVIEFGGTKAYSSPLVPSLQCQKNCSFVSGEASAIYIVFFAGAFMFDSGVGYLLAMGMVMGSLAGLIRMVEGGHFLSDVVFAGIFMAVTASVVKLFFNSMSLATAAGSKTE